ILVVGLVGAAVFFFLANGDKQAPSASQGAVVAGSPMNDSGAAAVPATIAPQLRIVALKRAQLEVRSAKGDKYVHRVYEPGEFFVVRVGAGFTVSADDGTAFEWRLGDQSLGLLQSEGGPVFSQNVDLAAQRTPVVTDTPLTHDIDPAAPPSNGAAT